MKWADKSFTAAFAIAALWLERVLSLRVNFSNCQYKWKQIQQKNTAQCARFTIIPFFFFFFFLVFFSVNISWLQFTSHSEHSRTSYVSFFSVRPPCQWPPFVSVWHARAIVVEVFYTDSLSNTGAHSVHISFSFFVFFFFAFLLLPENALSLVSPHARLPSHHRHFYLFRKIHRARIHN